ncbi:unnamed protein product [Closterium sp. NIES-53]
MEVARTSMIHAATPHFLWPFAVRYAAHQLNLWPHISLPETSPTLRWMGKVGDASMFQVWGSRAFVRDTSADKLSSHAILCVFLGFPRDAPGWQFYHPTSRRVLSSHDVTFDESVPFYCPPPVDPLPPQGPAPLGVSQVDPLPGTVPVKVAIDSGAARGAASGGAASAGAEPASAEHEGAESEGAGSGGAEPGGAEPGGAEPGGVEPEGAELGGAESEGAESGGAQPRGTASAGGPMGASPRLSPRREPLSPQQLREWFAQRTRLRSGAARAGGSAAGGTGAGGAGVTARAGGTEGAGVAGPGGARTRGNGAVGAGVVGGAGVGDSGVGGTGAGGAGAGGAGSGDPDAGAGGTGAGDSAGGTGARGAGAGGAGAGDPGAGGTGAGGTGDVDPGAGGIGTGGAGAGGTGAGGTMLRRPFFVPPPLSVLCQPDSPLPTPSPYSEQTDSFTERREPESRTDSRVRAVRTGRRVPRPRPPPVPGTHVMALRPSSVPLQVPLPPPPASSLPDVPGHEVKRPPDSLSVFKARYVARGFSQGQGVDFYQTFSPTPKMTTLRVLLYVAAQRDYELHSFDFSTAFLQGSLHEEIWLRPPPGFTGLFPAGTQWSLRRPVYGLRQAPREWHDTMRTTLAALGFAPSSADPSHFLRTDTLLSPFYVLVERTSQGYTFSLGFGSVSWRSTRLSSTLSSSCEAEIYAGAMAAQELRWLTYVVTDLGERPRSSPILYVDNKAMIALCHEHRLEHRTKHIALRYFLARELQQRGQLRLAYVATRANTTDIFTKALLPGDHQRFSTVLGLVPTLPHLLTA